MNKVIAIFITVVMCVPAFASDLEKEKRWQAQVVDALMDGDELYLTSDGIEFLAIEMASESDNSVGVVVIHGMGVHPNWEQVIQPVRIGLSEVGLHTLSIQMPVLANDAEVKDYEGLMPTAALRIDSAVAYLKEKGITRVVLIGHSLGTEMAAYYLSDAYGRTDDSIIGFVGVSLLETSPDYLSQIDIPVLDIYGSDDYPEALAVVSARKVSSSHNDNYRQIKITDANHFFDDKEVELLDEIKQFISSLN